MQQTKTIDINKSMTLGMLQELRSKQHDAELYTVIFISMLAASLAVLLLGIVLIVR